ncbi:MAG: hypothetical protein H6705_20415 [Myxococcales bacterium]|nr:hypothetical protein [Myxococcales bacterium]
MASKRGASALFAGLAGLLAACTGGSQVVYATGTCKTEHERCDARCGRLVDQRECTEGCLLAARQCMKAQGQGSEAGLAAMAAGEPPRISEHKALLVDFSGERPKGSPELGVELTGEVEAFDGVHRLMPGGGVGVRFTLPADLREADLVIEHAPGGDGTGCYVTITVGSVPLASRYAPPRTKQGALIAETWQLTPLLDTLRAEQEKGPLTLFIYNNQAAGSTAPYRIGSLQLLYRTLATAPGATPGEGQPTRSLTAPR